MNEATPSPKRSHRKKILALSIGAATAIILILLLWLAPEGGVYIRGRQVSFSAQSIARDDPFAGEGPLIHFSWDGPTGEFTRGDVFGFKMGGRLLRLDIVDDPVGAAKSALPASTSGLIRTLSSSNRFARDGAAEKLIALGPAAESAMPVFLDRYKNNDLNFESLITELAKNAGASVVPHLAVGLTNSQPKVRRVSAEALGAIGPAAKPAVPALTRALNDPNPTIAMGSALALHSIEKSDHGEIRVLVGLLKNEGPSVAVAAAFAIGEFGEDAGAAVQPLSELLKARDEEIAGAAARTLGLIGKPARPAIPALIELLNSANRQNVMFGLRALADFGPAAAPALEKVRTLAAQQEHAFDAVSALCAMGEIGVPALIELYKGKFTTIAVAKALMAQGPKAAVAVPVLREELRSGKRSPIIRAAMILGHIGEKARPAVPDLNEILETDHDPSVRVRVAEAIWRVDRQTNVVLPVMAAALENWASQTNALRSRRSDGWGQSDEQVASETLREIGPAAREAIPYLKLMRQSSFDEIRQSASRALEIVAPAAQGG